MKRELDGINSAINDAYEIAFDFGLKDQPEYIQKIFRTTLIRIASTAIDTARNEQNTLINDLGYAVQRIDDTPSPNN